MARLAGASRTTVSFVLNDRADVSISQATRERVLRAAEALGYRPHALASQLARGTSLTIGLVLRQAPCQVASDALLPQTVQGLSEAAREAGYEVLVEALPPEGSGYRRLLQSRRVDGLVVSGPLNDDLELAELYAEGSPVVLQGNLRGSPLPSVDVDNVAGARAAVEYLIEHGHRRIAMITNAPLSYTSASERLEGYRLALSEADIPFDGELVAEGAFEAQSGNVAITQLLARCSFTAVFVASDVLALGAMGAIRAAGLRIPDDISIVGFDDIPLAANFDPPLTTVSIPAYELGRTAGRLAVALTRGEAVPPRTLLGTVLKVRESVDGPIDRQLPRERQDGNATERDSTSAQGAREERRAVSPTVQGG